MSRNAKYEGEILIVLNGASALTDAHKEQLYKLGLKPDYVYSTFPHLGVFVGSPFNNYDHFHDDHVAYVDDPIHFSTVDELIEALQPDA